MNISDLISTGRISCNNESRSKKKVLEALSILLAQDAEEISKDEIFDSLINRERLGSTGLGRGVALPHARLPDCKQAIGAFIKLSEGIDFDAIDQQPTDLLFCLLVPDHFTDEHLDILAELAKLFGDKEFCDQVRHCENEEQIFKLLNSQTTTSAA